MKNKLLSLMGCSVCGSSFEVKVSEDVQGEIKEGILICPSCGKEYHIRNFIPRFVESDKYVKSFSLEWNIHKKTQLDSQTKTYESEKDFLRKTGFDSEEMKGKLILDVGCGAGRFLEVVSKFGGEVIGIDLSYAVDASYENFGHLPNVHIIQADIFDLPFKEESFDYIYSIGVLHHTPNTKEAFLKLLPLLKKDGEIAIWVYAKCLYQHYVDHHYRKITTKLPKRLLYLLSYIAVPLYYLKKVPILRTFLQTFIPTSEHLNWRWRVLDTFDWYSPQFQHKHTCYEVMRWFNDAGLKNVKLLDFPVAVWGKK